MESHNNRLGAGLIEQMNRHVATGIAVLAVLVTNLIQVDVEARVEVGALLARLLQDIPFVSEDVHSRLMFFLAIPFIASYAIGTYGWTARWYRQMINRWTKGKLIRQTMFWFLFLCGTFFTAFGDEGRECRLCVHHSYYLSLFVRGAACWVMSVSLIVVISNINFLRSFGHE